jgi:hypothetical protein
MQIPLCRHIKSNGIICRSPALRGKAGCFYHQASVATRSTHPERRDYRAYALQGLTPAQFQQLLISGDRASILRAICTVTTALAADEISTRRAGRILFGLNSLLNGRR